PAGLVELHDPGGGGRAGVVELAGIPGSAERDRHEGHPLRDQVDEARHRVDRRLARHAARRRRDERRVRHGVERRRLHDESPVGGHHRRQGVGRLRLRRRAARARARRAGAAARPASLLLEEREVGAGNRAPHRGRAGLLGGLRLPQLRRPVARAALPRRLSWQLARVVELVDETSQTQSIVLEPPEWPGHRAGQHVDVRLTAEDGYQAERSYSIASAPEDDHLVLTVERLDDGEVSPYLAGELRPGDELELRGPIGGYFVWEAQLGGPLLLLAGGSGIVPLRAMLRHRAATGSTIATRLLYSAKSLADVIYRDELESLAANDEVDVRFTLTREEPEGWHG